MPRLLTLSAAIIVLGSHLCGQSETAATSIAMPEDRAAASYAIYSQLLPAADEMDPLGEKTALITPVTADSAGLGRSCSPKSPDLGSFANPHNSVHPPLLAYRDFWEILDDFDAHCHEGFRLNAANLHSRRRLQVLTREEIGEFVSVRGGGLMHHTVPSPELIRKYDGASGLYTFSTVFFNKRRTVALVHRDFFFGNLGAEGAWVAFTLVDGRWKAAPWSSDSYIS